MDTVIREINESLLKILSELESNKQASQKDLEDVNNKINEKVDEAKDYKVEVDKAKSKIKTIDAEIEALEIDLVDLNERFGKKDLNAILEAGHKEINSKIMEKQNQITKHRQKIGELADRARSIKDLLINLKKDKSIKEERLDIFIETYDYYNESLIKIIDYAKNNPKTLNSYEMNYNNLKYDYTDEPISEVFDEIESMDKDFEDEIKIETKESDELNKEEEVNLNNIFDKLRSKELNFDEINKSIDEEYNNIFDAKLEDNLEESKLEEEFEKEINLDEVTKELDLKEEPDNIFNISESDLNLSIEDIETPNIFEEEQLKNNITDNKLPDIFGNNIEPDKTNENIEVTNFFKEYNLNFNNFDKEKQEIINNIFNRDHFQKMLEILKDNQINLEYIYHGLNLLEKGNAEELDQILTKLLLAGQSKNNIELVLNSLGNITSSNLTEVINSFGSEIKDANISDILMKTIKLQNDFYIDAKLDYLKESDFTEDDVVIMESKLNKDILDQLVTFPELVLTNYYYLKDIGINNIKEVFMNHAQMFILNPDKFKAIFTKYDKQDLIRCIEKNAAVIEQL